jgi:hypothetical protein
MAAGQIDFAGDSMSDPLCAFLTVGNRDDFATNS